jgi:hypothetical protein
MAFPQQQVKEAKLISTYRMGMPERTSRNARRLFQNRYPVMHPVGE